MQKGDAVTAFGELNGQKSWQPGEVVEVRRQEAPHADLVHVRFEDKARGDAWINAADVKPAEPAAKAEPAKAPNKTKID